MYEPILWATKSCLNRDYNLCYNFMSLQFDLILDIYLDESL